MATSVTRRRWARRLTRVVACTAVLGGCGSSLFLFWGNPFERVRDAVPLASINLPLRDWPVTHYHAETRGELVFLQQPNLEVYRIDPQLTRLRRVRVAAEDVADFWYISAFPKSPLAVLSGPPHKLLVVSTETGQVMRSIPLPDEAVSVVVSPDERWLAVDLQKTDVIPSREPNTGATSRGVIKGPGPFGLLDLTTGELVRRVDRDDEAAVRELLKPWAVGPKRSAHPPVDSRTVTATAVNPINGDFLAGYSRPSFTLWSRLGGTVRIWSAQGDRLVTFAAHRDTQWPDIRFMAVSADGKYLVTAGEDTLRIWDYQAVSGSGN